MNHSKAVFSIAVVALLITGAALFAGPLSPPAGPVASTYKTLSEVEPRIAVNAINTPGDGGGLPSLYTISAPGSYYLTGNITGVIGKHGIKISADNVTLDLNGFELAGVPAMGSFSGVIEGTSGLTGVTVRNGTVRDWGGNGVSLGTFAPSNIRVEGVLVKGNGFDGIHVGTASSISHCSSRENGAYGFAASSRSTVAHCTSHLDVGRGIWTSQGCAVTGCTVSSSGGDGIFADDNSVITNCTVTTCATSGITVDMGCLVKDSAVRGSGGVGIVVGTGSRVRDCVVHDNVNGGISASNQCGVSACVVTTNGLAGITVGADCVVTENTCNQNGMGSLRAGIQTTGANNRIEGNNCSNNGRGYETLTGSFGNLFIGNSASSNTINFLFVANNRYGPIVDITAATAAVSGNTAAGTMTTADPHANFRY